MPTILLAFSASIAPARSLAPHPRSHSVYAGTPPLLGRRNAVVRPSIELSDNFVQHVVFLQEPQ